MKTMQSIILTFYLFTKRELIKFYLRKSAQLDLNEHVFDGKVVFGFAQVKSMFKTTALLAREVTL